MTRSSSSFIILLLLGTTALSNINAFVPPIVQRIPPISINKNPSSCSATTAGTFITSLLQMSDNDDNDDWHSDYDPSKYESSSSSYSNDDNNDEYGGVFNDRQRRAGYDNVRYDRNGGGGGGRSYGRGGRGRGGRSGRGRGRGRGRGGQRTTDFGPTGHDYTLSDDATNVNNSKYTEDEIHELLAERLQAKFARDFGKADSIQMGLIDGGVFVHDGLKEWRADGIPYGSFRDDGGGQQRSRKVDNQQYEKSPHSTTDVEGATDDLINKLCHERTKFKMMRQYDKADKVREGLRTKFNVLIDDRLKQWSVGGDFGEEHNAQRELADKFANRGYIKSTSSLSLDNDDDDDNDDVETEKYIQHHVDARAIAKKERKFDTADKIRLDLAQRFDVTINDKLKLWSIGGVFEELGGRMGKPKGVYTRRGGGELSSDDEDAIARMLSDRYHAKKQKQFDKADDIRDELMREYNIRIDDRSNEWRVDTDDYAQSGSDSTTLSTEEVEFIDIKLKERHSLKRERQYEDADAIRDSLKERFNVKIDDRTKEWSVEVVDSENLAVW